MINFVSSVLGLPASSFEVGLVSAVLFVFSVSVAVSAVFSALTYLFNFSRKE